MKIAIYAKFGLIISALFLMTACGFFGGGSDEPESEAAAAAPSESESTTESSTESSTETTTEPSTESNSSAESSDDATASEDAQGDSMVTESGLEIIMIEEGSGEQPNEGDIVQVHYTGTLEDGTEFDSSVGSGPFTFPLGQGAVIPGWDEGIAMLNEGGKAKLIIPSELGYGAAGAGGVIPPDAILHFDVELVGILPAAPESPQTVSASDYEETDTGLKYFDMEEGTGATPEEGQTVTVHYTGWLTDGTGFDSSFNRGTPFAFPLGRGSVIAGWDEGLATMKVGGKRQLVIPPDLAYGDQGFGQVIPGGSTLIFEVELIDVQ